MGEGLLVKFFDKISVTMCDTINYAMTHTPFTLLVS